MQTYTSTATTQLAKLFTPRSVAVVGASADEQKLGNIVLRNIIESGFRGALYPVNPHADVIRGMTCYKKYADIELIPDLAIIAIPAELVAASVEAIAHKGTKHLVIFSAGFKESGEAGLRLEEQLRALAEKHHLSILGPNCLGFVNTVHPINATFGAVVKQPGNLRFISQSGAIATSVFDWADQTKVGFTDFVTLGNKTVLSEVDVLRYWLQVPSHPHVPATQRPDVSDYHPVGMYLESITDGVAFMAAVRETARKHPVFLLKPGKSAAARSAMQSHTGALAGDDAVLDAALHVAGVLRCDELEDLFDASRLFAWTRAPEGKRVAVISNAGGPAVIASDSIAQYGLELAAIEGETKKTLERQLPRAASLKNPIDVLGDALADRYEQAITAVLRDRDVHAVIVILTPQVMTQIEETAQVIGRLSQQYQQPIVCSFMGGSIVARGERVLNEYRIPSFHFPERAVKALSAMWRWQQWREREQRVQQEHRPMSETQVSATAVKERVVTPAVAARRLALTSFEMDSLLRAVGIQAPPTAAIADEKQADLFAQAVEYPVVAKLVGDALLHKTEIRGVITNIRNQAELQQAVAQLVDTRRSLPEPARVQLQLQKQVRAGLEVLVGVKRDPQFGPVLLFGAGGQMAELLQDHHLAILPASDAQLRELIERSKMYPLLRGFRGGRKYSVAALIDVLQRFAALALAAPELQELEINPLILNAEGMWAVDGKGVLRHG